MASIMFLERLAPAIVMISGGEPGGGGDQTRESGFVLLG
jgi:hypothetical protein